MRCFLAHACRLSSKGQFHTPSTSELEIPKDSALEAGFARGPAGVQFGSIESLSQPLFERFLIPFELVSVLIVVALLGVVLLGRKRI